MTVCAPTNTFKRRLLAQELQFGLWMSLTSPVASEALSLVGYDWLMFDTEHAPIEIAGLQTLLQAAAAGHSACVVRPAGNDQILVKRVLDLGAQTLLIPFVQSAEEAAEAVAAAKYPPMGARGVAGLTRASRFGLTQDYFATANDEICVLVQLETMTALEALEEIAQTLGVDGIFIGPSDLAASMGHIGKPGTKEVQAEIRRAVNRLRALGKPAGILATHSDDARRYVEWGFSFVAIGVDIAMLLKAARENLQAVNA